MDQGGVGTLGTARLQIEAYSPHGSSKVLDGVQIRPELALVLCDHWDGAGIFVI